MQRSYLFFCLLLVAGMVALIIQHFCLGRGRSEVRKIIELQQNNEKLQITTSVTGQILWKRRTHEILEPVRHLQVEDVFRNQTAKLAGVRVEISTPTHSKNTWLGGQNLWSLSRLSWRKSPVDFSDPWNPTVFAEFSKQQGIGLVAEDDIFRQQVRVFYDPFEQKAGLRSESLCLAPFSEIKFVWSAYPAQNSYWDFINDLRSAWGVNHIIEGSTIWFMPDDILAMDKDYLKQRLNFQGVKTASMFGGWTDPLRKPSPHSPALIGFGTAVLTQSFAEVRSRLKLAISKLKNAQPGIEVLIYFDAQRDSSINAEKMYSDSLFLDEKSQAQMTDWQKQFNQTWSVYPTLKNKFGARMNESAELARTLGADGIYWDEMESLDYSGVRFSKSEWDGNSCTLDRQAKVLEKIGYTNLLSSGAKFKYAQTAGKILANSPPTTRIFNERPDRHMVEGQHLSDYSSYIHLSTPLSFIGTDDSWEKIIAPIAKGLLPAGVRLDYKTPLFAHLFPIEVFKIFPGAILGRNKIVASRSGVYGWQSDCRHVEVLHFNEHGQVSGPRDDETDATQACRIDAHLKPNEVIIISRADLNDSHSAKTPVFFLPAFR